MEEFKIININQFKKETETQEETVGNKIDKIEGYKPPKKRYILLIVLIIVISIVLVIINITRTFSDYDVENRWEREDTSETKYNEFKSNLLKYSNDGVFYTNFDGSLIWNYTYNMTKPTLDVCENYGLIYDKKGNEIDVFSINGFINSITTSSPVIDAKVSNNGTIAVMEQEDGVTYLQLYDTKGKTLVSGEIHPENSGYPISMALSSDATRLAISMIDINSGNVGSRIKFFDFSEEGRKKQDNVVAEYEYGDIIIPQIEFFKGDKAVAFGENEIIIFNDNTDVTVAKEIYISEEIKNIFYNDQYFGYIYEAANEKGEIESKINVYNLLGLLSLDKNFNFIYDDVTLLSNNNIVLKKGNEIELINLQGIEKFSYMFDENIYGIIPAGLRKYYVLKETATEKIHLK